MSKVIGLGKIRKQRAQADRKAKADENAIAFGRTKAQRMSDAARAKTEARRLDDHKRDKT